MNGMDMPAGASMSFVAAFAMWATMMIVMMLPSAVPTIALYGRAQPDASRPRRRALFALGYLLAWVTASLPATGLQLGLSQQLLLTPALTPARPWLIAALLLVAGTWQVTRWKAACLTHCQSPLAFLLAHWRTRSAGAVAMGLHHGLYCLGCCWALMLLLFGFGVMDARAIVALAAYVAIEKHVMKGPGFARVTGALLIGSGVVLLVVNGWR